MKRISVLRNGIRRDTHTYILTFSTPDLPTSIKVGFQLVKVDVYVPSPLRCYRCQRYGHHESNCRSTPVCPKCVFEGEDHDQKTCSKPPLCVSCKSSHPTYSKECSVWKDEKEILSIKFKDNVTFLEARKTVEKRRSDQALLSKNTTYANFVSPLPTNGHCPTCELLAKKLLQKFPEMTDELKALIPNVQVTTPSTQTPLASETNEPCSAPSKPTNSQSIALQKTSNPSTSLQNIPLKKGSKPSPASKPSPPSQQPPKKPQPSSSQSTTRYNVSPKENKSNDPTRPKKKKKKGLPQSLNRNLEIPRNHVKSRSKKMILSLPPTDFRSYRTWTQMLKIWNERLKIQKPLSGPSPKILGTRTLTIGTCPKPRQVQ